MTENVLQTLQNLVQDVIAPDVREVKVRLAALETTLDIRFSAIEQRLHVMDEKIDQRLAALDQKIELQFQAIMSAISEAKAHGELAGMRTITALAERVAVLESRQR